MSLSFIQKLGRANIHYTVLCIYYSLGIVVLCPIITYFVPRPHFPHYSWGFLGLVLLSAIFAFL